MKKVELVLGEILRDEGLSICADFRRFEALLNDLCPGEKRYTSALSRSLTENVVNDLLVNKGSAPREALLGRLQRQLEDRLALTSDIAKWTINTWYALLPQPTSPLESFFQMSGNGSQRTQSFELSSGFVLFAAEYEGSGNFIADLFGDGGNIYKTTVANFIGAERSIRPVYITKAEIFRLDIQTGSANWSIDLKHPKSLPRFAQNSRTFHGRGQNCFVSELREDQEWTIRISFDSADHFYCRLFSIEGRFIRHMANEIGPCAVERSIKVGRSGDYLIDVCGNGNWSFEVFGN